MITKSLAGTTRMYAVVQARISEDGDILLVQGKGHKVNRDYGVKAAIHLNTETLGTLFSDERNADLFTEQSLAKSNKKYIALQMATQDRTDRLHFQIAGVKGGNREYGHAFDLVVDSDVADLLSFYQKEMAEPTGMPTKAPEVSAPSASQGNTEAVEGLLSDIDALVEDASDDLRSAEGNASDAKDYADSAKGYANDANDAAHSAMKDAEHAEEHISEAKRKLSDIEDKLEELKALLKK